ncbi:ARM repeat-containing protein [Obba rivulosa]|uniref:ARM repeat-containing protein n=1 Tax=Obba rivulosa TaxID=1052685 RepID=A0A8E2DQC9_9APHY|nr:ARM repeat-containing protein [Obba rivulosa]
MTIITVNVPTLKKVKNTLIGSPTAKVSLARDEELIATIVNCVNNPHLQLADEPQSSRDDIRIEAAHVIASLSYGGSAALRTLMRVNAPDAFLFAISRIRSTEPPALKAAITRAFRAMAAALADTVGPSQWGLRTNNFDMRNDAKITLDYIFQSAALDVLLPLLCDPNPQVIISAAQFVASAVRTQAHRAAVSEWLPPSERTKEIKGKRGWEKPGVTKSPSRQGGWVVRVLTSLLHRNNAKLQEAALSALASLAKDNQSVALTLARAPPEGGATLSTVLSLCKLRFVDLQLAACICATNVIRSAHPGHTSTTDHAAALSVMYVVNRLIASDSETPQTRTKACFTLFSLVSDDKELCKLAYDRGSLSKLASLVKAITPLERSVEWEEDEPESISRLREAALTTVAAISLFDDDIRCEVTGTLKLIPAIQVSLSHQHLGVRYAACQCVRAISRSVAVLRTNIVDTGLGMSVYQLFQKQNEDRRITYAASAVICNLVNDCSPLRPLLLERGVLERLVELLHSGDAGLRLNALWAIKNLLYKGSSGLKRKVMDAVKWPELVNLLTDIDPETQEQAFHVLRHIADGPEDVELIFQEMGKDVLLNCLARAMESDHDDVLLQAVCVLANIANSLSHQGAILSSARILENLRSCLFDAKVEVRRPAVSCVLELVRANPRSHKELHDAGIDSTLRHICEYSGGGISVSPTRRFLAGAHMGLEDDWEVKEKAKEALHWLERNAEVDMSI